MAESKKYIKTYCPHSKAYGLITTEVNNGLPIITNFYEIDDDTAKNIETQHDGALPAVSSNLKPCAVCGSKKAGCCDKKRQCPVPKGELWYQCLFCNQLEIKNAGSAGGSADIYFLLDDSGSMSRDDRCEAARAVEALLKSLQGQGNTYSFVAWGTGAGYLFDHETNMSKMSLALSAYRNGTEYGGLTNADVAFEYIECDVKASRKPVRIIFVTDGYLSSDSKAMRARNKLLEKANVEILAIGITGANTATLQKIGTVAEFSVNVGPSSALVSTFAEIAKRLKDGRNNF